jgi:hypothetical protein
VDALLDWLLGDAKKLVNADKELSGKDPSGAGDVAVRQQKLLESKEELLRCAKVSQQILNYAGLLDQFIGESEVVILEGDSETAHKQHKEWFASLANATRRTTAAVLALQTMLAENKWIGQGVSSAIPAAALSEAWGKTEDAIDAEMEILAQTSTLETVHFCVRSGLAAAERMEDCLSRTKDDYHLLNTLDGSLQHAMIFPELESDREFLMHLETLCELPLRRGDATNDAYGYMIEVDSNNRADFKALSRHAHNLSQRGVATPLFMVKNCKLVAKYACAGIPLSEFKGTYQISEHFLKRLWNTCASSASAFKRDVGRIHGAITQNNIFVDLISERITLGAHALALDEQREDGADMSALSAMVEDLRAANGLVFAIGNTLKFRVECSTCSTLCLRSTTCPGGAHHFCEDCLCNLLQSNIDHNGAMRQVACPMGCGAAWSDAELLRCLPTTEASEQVHKKRRRHLEIQLRRQLHEEKEAEIRAIQRSQNESNDQELPQSIISRSLEIMTDQCRKCGQAFIDWDGCMAIHCPTCGDSYVCAYCLMVGSEEAVHYHIGHGHCPVRNQMFPGLANGDTFHQGPSTEEEHAVARKIRIVDELHTFFLELQPSQRVLLAQRIRKYLEDNGVDFSLVHNMDEQQL